jgi:hypothetical protein
MADMKMIGRRARLIALVHRLVRTLDVAGEQLRVEQRGRQAIARELSLMDANLSGCLASSIARLS